MSGPRFGGRQPTGTPSLAWSSVVVVVSLLTGASIVHNIFKPDLTEEDAVQISKKYKISNWYKDVVYFLLNFACLPNFEKFKIRSLKLKAVKYCILESILYWKDPAGVLLKCLVEEKVREVIDQMHKDICGGHHYWKATAYAVLRNGYYWPTLFSDTFQKIKACDECQRFAGKQKLLSLPLKQIVDEAPFQQWGLDFIGEIYPHSSNQHRWILTATDYFTKWIETIPTQNATDKTIPPVESVNQGEDKTEALAGSKPDKT